MRALQLIEMTHKLVVLLLELQKLLDHLRDGRSVDDRNAGGLCAGRIMSKRRLSSIP